MFFFKKKKKKNMWMYILHFGVPLSSGEPFFFRSVVVFFIYLYVYICSFACFIWVFGVLSFVWKSFHIYSDQVGDFFFTKYTFIHILNSLKKKRKRERVYYLWCLLTLITVCFYDYHKKNSIRQTILRTIVKRKLLIEVRFYC